MGKLQNIWERVRRQSAAGVSRFRSAAILAGIFFLLVTGRVTVMSSSGNISMEELFPEYVGKKTFCFLGPQNIYGKAGQAKNHAPQIHDEIRSHGHHLPEEIRTCQHRNIHELINVFYFIFPLQSYPPKHGKKKSRHQSSHHIQNVFGK